MESRQEVLTCRSHTSSNMGVSAEGAPSASSNWGKLNSRMPAQSGPRLTAEQRDQIFDIAQACGNSELRGINITHVARQFSVTSKTAKKWLLRGLQAQPDNTDKPRPGRPSKLPQRVKDNIRRYAKHRDGSKKISRRLAKTQNIEFSPSSVRNVLKSGRNPLKYVSIKSDKVLNSKNIPTRISFCREHLHANFKKWVFIDQFDDYPTYHADGSATHSWQGQNQQKSTQPGTPWSFRMYVAVGWNFKSPLVFVAPSPPEHSKQHKSTCSFNAHAYVMMMTAMKPILEQQYPNGDYVVIQDHALQHAARVSRKAVEEMRLPMLMDYPAQSWDINLIKNVWGVFRDLLTHSKAKTTDGWYSVYRSAWMNLKLSTINKLVEGMHDRLQSIIDAEGIWVSHH